MMAITHAALASAAVPLILSASNPMVLGLAILGSQLPDIDTTSSLIGQVCYPISKRLEARYPHRTATHSFLAVTVIALVWGLIILMINRYAELTLTRIEWMALWLGMLISCIADTFTIKGTQLFFPNPVWCYSGSSWDKRRLKTGGTGEMWVLCVAVVITSSVAFSGALSGPGGLAGNVGQTIGIRNSVVDAYNAQASTHHVWANVSGVWATDRTSADGKYWIIGADNYEFILSDGSGIYKTGENLIANRLTTSKGQPAQTKVQTLTFDDEPVSPALHKLLQSHPGAAIFLSGTLTIDFPEDIQQTNDSKQFKTLVVSGSSAKLSFCPIEKAIAFLADQYGAGSLDIKIIDPKPEKF